MRIAMSDLLEKLLPAVDHDYWTVDALHKGAVSLKIRIDDIARITQQIQTHMGVTIRTFTGHRRYNISEDIPFIRQIPVKLVTAFNNTFVHDDTSNIIECRFFHNLK